MNQIHITIVKDADKNLLDSVNRLKPQLNQWKPEPISMKWLETILKNPMITMLAAKDSEKIIGMLLLINWQNLYVKKFFIEDVVVDQQYRGQGIATKLFNKAIELAKQKGLDEIDLGTSTWRTEANRLYQKLGFKTGKSKYYSLNLKDTSE